MARSWMLFSTLVALGALQGANGSAYMDKAQLLHCSFITDDPDEWIKDGGWILIVIGVLVSFWGLAVVCEDYFVPAITILCEYKKIPDDVAGATFMAAGASSPEMFACFISLFVTHTALGAGTIIGSEIFNHLCITAAAVLYAAGGELQLDWRMVMREALFYLFALLLLIAALTQNSTIDGSQCKADVYAYYRKANNECNVTGGNYLKDSADSKDWVDPKFADAYCVYWWQGLFLIAGYVVYALVCAYFEQIKARFCPDKEEPRMSEKGVAESRASGYQNEPSANFGAERQSQKEPTAGDLQVAAFAPAHIQGNFLYNIHLCEEEEAKFSCFMWKRSRFYHVRSISQNAWKLRWFEMSNESGLQSFTSNTRKTKNRHFPINGGATLEKLDEARLLFSLTTKKHGKMVFHAPNQENYDKMYNQIETFIQSLAVESGPSNPLHGNKDESAADEEGPAEGDDQEDHHVLIEWPHDAGPLTVFVHCILIVPKYLVYYTVPDVRLGGVEGEKKYPQSIAMCFVWLVGWSIVMAECLDVLGKLLGINELTMGMTVAAVGTSFPNVFASIIVAKQGLGNMACSNALGGNVFNVFMGLGLPWFCYSLFGLGFTVDSDVKMYYGMQYGGEGNAVIFPIIVLIILIVGHMTLLISTGFKLYKVHAYIFIAIYVAFLIWVLAYNTKSPLDG